MPVPHINAKSNLQIQVSKEGWQSALNFCHLSCTGMNSEIGFLNPGSLRSYC